jgi:Type II secretion system (T2SS), protein E, N-terminal domain
MGTESLYPKIAAAMVRAKNPFPAYLAQNYPRVLQKIEFCWGEPEAEANFETLLLDPRLNRQGFPPEAIAEITLLKDVHDFFCPKLEFNPYDPFSHTGVFNAYTDDTAAAADQASRKSVWPMANTQEELTELLRQRFNGQNIYPVQGRPIGEIFVHYGLADRRTLDIMQNSQKRHTHQKTRIGAMLVDLGTIQPEDLECALCVQTGIIMVNILTLPVPASVTRLIPLPQAVEKQVVPVGIFNDTLALACATPSDFKDRHFFSMLTKHKIEPVYASRFGIINRLNMYGVNTPSHVAEEQGDIEFTHTELTLEPVAGETGFATSTPKTVEHDPLEFESPPIPPDRKEN